MHNMYIDFWQMNLKMNSSYELFLIYSNIEMIIIQKANIESEMTPLICLTWMVTTI